MLSRPSDMVAALSQNPRAHFLPNWGGGPAARQKCTNPGKMGRSREWKKENFIVHTKNPNEKKIL